MCNPSVPGGDTKTVICQDDPHIVVCTAEPCMPCSDYCNTNPPGGGGLGPTR